MSKSINIAPNTPSKKTINSLIERAQTRQRENNVPKKPLPIFSKTNDSQLSKNPTNSAELAQIEEFAKNIDTGIISSSNIKSQFGSTSEAFTEVLTKVWEDIVIICSQDLINVFFFRVNLKIYRNLLVRKNHQL